MRYTPAIIVLTSSVIAFASSVGVLTANIANSRSGPVVLLAVGLAIASFVGAAWAVGRVRRLRSITPEAIITPPTHQGH